MIEFQPFKAGHLSFLTPQPAQRREHAQLVRSGAVELLESNVALSGWHGSTCVGAAGLIHVRPHKAVAWMILSDGIGPYMLPVVRKVRRVLSAVPYKRIELTVSADFQAGHHFARLLGAVCETPEPMNFYGADGGDEMMYAIIKGAQL